MISRFENPWDSAAGDGALTPVGVARPECDIDELMDAWYRERRECIECRMYLDAAGRLLRKILCEEGVPTQLRRRAKCLLQAIREGAEADDLDPAEGD